MQPLPLLRSAKILLVAALATTSGTTLASPDSQTRLVSCGKETCLLVTGRRTTAESRVLLNGRPIAIEGGLSWRASVPMSTVHEISKAYERSVEVTVTRPDGQEEWSEDVRLPIGLLGHAELAELVVTAH